MQYFFNLELKQKVVHGIGSTDLKGALRHFFYWALNKQRRSCWQMGQLFVTPNILDVKVRTKKQLIAPPELWPFEN